MYLDIRTSVLRYTCQKFCAVTEEDLDIDILDRNKVQKEVKDESLSKEDSLLPAVTSTLVDNLIFF